MKSFFSLRAILGYFNMMKFRIGFGHTKNSQTTVLFVLLVTPQKRLFFFFSSYGENAMGSSLFCAMCFQLLFVACHLYILKVDMF